MKKIILISTYEKTYNRAWVVSNEKKMNWHTGEILPILTYYNIDHLLPFLFINHTLCPVCQFGWSEHSRCSSVLAPFGIQAYEKNYLTLCLVTVVNVVGQAALMAPTQQAQHGGPGPRHRARRWQPAAPWPPAPIQVNASDYSSLVTV